MAIGVEWWKVTRGAAWGAAGLSVVLLGLAHGPLAGEARPTAPAQARAKPPAPDAAQLWPLGARPLHAPP